MISLKYDYKKQTLQYALIFLFGWITAVIGSAAVDYTHKKQMLELEKEKLMLQIELHKIDLQKD